MLKKSFFILIPLIIVLQFFTSTKNQVADHSSELVNIKTHLQMDDAVFALIENACLDCHSNTTVYPWYARIAPVNFWINSHIKGGKQNLNFSDWNTYDEDQKSHKLQEIIDVMYDKRMPPKSYTFGHSNARLSTEERMLIIRWAENLK